ncbi:hypothetical protein CYMTET_13824 [Cymbomonas tetramitiformis]|uniref:Uncharacterized protein n=1 Tax=Cymbomonas tetramitiformis TaxID=36881 RepID=A0AAE0LAZ8_9CHLO|nr:hypothetical protein CYMTET_13824 [Cymbomonas tetramitiformis]
MGGGNGQKSAKARERAQAKLAAEAKGSQLKTNEKSMSLKCAVCMQTFMCTSTEVKLREHSDNKHPKEDFYRCFPSMTPEAQEAAAADAAAAEVAAKVAAQQAPKEKQKAKVYKGSK